MSENQNTMSLLDSLQGYKRYKQLHLGTAREISGSGE